LIVGWEGREGKEKGGRPFIYGPDPPNQKKETKGLRKKEADSSLSLVSPCSGEGKEGKREVGVPPPLPACRWRKKRGRVIQRAIATFLLLKGERR